MIDWLVRTTCRGRLITAEPLPPGAALRTAVWLPAIAGRLSGMGGPAAAVTLGRTVVVHPSVRVTPQLVRHELAHVRQWQKNRWTFPVRYVVNHFRYGYDQNPYEVEARAAEAITGEAQ
jgi:hypothetical protein